MSTKKNVARELSQHELVLTRVFDAPRALVFKMWTDPQHLARWWGPHKFTTPICELDVRPGGVSRIHMRGPDGTVYPMTGVYQEVVEDQRLVCRSSPLDEQGQPLFEVEHTVTFVEQDGKTTLTLHVRVVKATTEAAPYLAGMKAGWTQSLERLAENVAMETGRVVIERTFDAPIATVWKALADKDTMQQWSFGINEFKPEVGFEFTFDAEDKGVKYIHQCVVTDVIPQQRLAYTWRYEGYAGTSLVTIELFAEENKTRLRLTHEGLETFPATGAFARENFVQGWRAIIGSSLKSFVEGTSGQSSTADREIITTRVIDAPRELVFEAWTNPKHVAQWWGPNGFTNTIHEMDVRPGGVWRFVMHGPDGVDYQNKIVFIEVVKPERLVYSHVSGPQFHMTVTFDEHDGKTKLTMWMVFDTAAERDTVAQKFRAVEGAQQTLARCAEYVAKMG